MQLQFRFQTMVQYVQDAICNKAETDLHQDVSFECCVFTKLGIVNICLIIKYVLNNHNECNMDLLH